MSIKNVENHIDAIERKLTKSIKIAEKGPNMKLGDVAKMGRKTNSIVTEINKSIKEYDVSLATFVPPSCVPLLEREKKRNGRLFSPGVILALG